MTKEPASELDETSMTSMFENEGPAPPSDGGAATEMASTSIALSSSA